MSKFSRDITIALASVVGVIVGIQVVDAMGWHPEASAVGALIFGLAAAALTRHR